MRDHCLQRSLLNVLFGEKKVKLFNLKFELLPTPQNQPEVCVNLILVHLLTRLSDWVWVLDVSFVKDCDGSSCLAVGCSDNSIDVWDISNSSLMLEVHSPEENSAYGSSSVSKCAKLHFYHYKAVNIFRLMGREGSIFRIERSFSGSKFVSASDDGSAHIWAVHAKWKDSDSIEKIDSSVLCGHNA